MSKRNVDLRAYKAAEERLLDFFSPPAATGDELPQPAAELDADISQPQQAPEAPSEDTLTPGETLDPAVDSVLHIISDNLDIVSLISSANDVGFSGFDDSESQLLDVPTSEGELIFGLCRSQSNSQQQIVEIKSSEDYLGCTPPKRARCTADGVVMELPVAPVMPTEPHGLALVLLEAVASQAASLLTNGNINDSELEDHLQPEVDHEVEVEQEPDDVMEPVTECVGVIYDTMAVEGEDGNVVVLTDEQCCEIIVGNEQELTRALLLTGNGALLEQQQFNGVGDGAYEELEEDEAQPSVYLSDAALREQEQQLYLTEDGHSVNPQEQLVCYGEDCEDANNLAEDGHSINPEQRLVCYTEDCEEDPNNENATFVDDTPLEEERPDICTVYEHELEDHDDLAVEEVEEEDEEVGIYQQQTPIIIGSDVEEQVVEQQPLVVVAPPPLPPQSLSASTTTEFPVSSTSMPQGSDYDDYDDELTELEPATLPTTDRKYLPLLKNTLSAEAVDRKLASISQTQPQLSLNEKIAQWPCAQDCEPVEDVANFELQLAQREEQTQHSFHEFSETLASKLLKITKDIMQVAEAEAEADTSLSLSGQEEPQQLAQRIVQQRENALPEHQSPSEQTLSRQQLKCQSYKRLLQAVNQEQQLQQEQQQPMPIVLVDDTDSDDDCYEVKDNASKATLVPERAEEWQQPQPQLVLKTTQTQTSDIQTLPTATKETSTTDLERHQPLLEQATSRHFADAMLDVMRERIEQQMDQQMDREMDEQDQATSPPRGSAQQQDALFYEQHEFCNYLGLTEMATANAVATAMRELANSTVARRSLRVRPQQQLDRMRSDVRGRRRERDRAHNRPMPIGDLVAPSSNTSQPEALDQQHHHHYPDAQQQLHSSSSALTGLEASPPPCRPTDYELGGAAASGLDFVCQIPAATADEARQSAQLYDFYYRAQGDRQDEPEADHSLEAAFAKAYAAAVPAQQPSQLLHEQMQQRLQLARESKPAIYIVQATSSNLDQEQIKPPTAQENKTAAQLASWEVRGPRPSLADTKLVKVQSPKRKVSPAPAQLSPPMRTPTPTPIPTQRKASPAPKKKAPKVSSRRRQLSMPTAAAAAAGARNRRQTALHVRDLVTRSTTHMNSKLLRNRKINLLKTYALSDATATTTASQKRSKRLSGGSTGHAKGAKTPKAVKATLRKAAAKAPPTPVLVKQPNPQLAPVEREVRTVICNRNDLMEVVRPHPAQHRLHQQQQIVPKRKAIGGAATAARAKSRKEALVSPAGNKIKTVKMKRGQRAQSLPAVVNLGDGQSEELTPTASPRNELRSPSPTTPKRHLDTHEFITNHAVVRPPVYSPAARRFVANVRKAAEEQLSPPSAELLQPPSLAAFISSHDTLPKPAMIYPQPVSPLSQRWHFSRRRESAGHAHVQAEEQASSLPDIRLMAPGGLMRLTCGSPQLRNPLAGKHGRVLYMFYELEQLIVVQEKLITFWKYSKAFNVLLQKKPSARQDQQLPQDDLAAKHGRLFQSGSESERSPGGSTTNESQQWVHLGRARRITNDNEIQTPYGNRLCVHNATPVYIEMRSHALDHNKRESKLLSLYVNVYYYCEEELRPKMHSVHLDAVNCEPAYVIYTSITESRYFIMAWQQEQVMGKPRSGICKYSLTPTLDTLASIREFKQLRHELKYIECLTDDRLIGYGGTRITIWDHRSGDTLMNYDLGIELGRNLGAMHLPSFDMEQSSLLILYQHIKDFSRPPELHIIACEMSHATPSHRVLHIHRLPTPQFDHQVVAINTADHLILKARTEDEIWISAADPRLLTYVAPQSTQRFYTRHRSQVIELSPQWLTVDSISNYMLKLATQHQQQHQQQVPMPKSNTLTALQ